MLHLQTQVNYFSDIILGRVHNQLVHDVKQNKNKLNEVKKCIGYF